jgi:SNF2 family DNA or RNA helicase
MSLYKDDPSEPLHAGVSFTVRLDGVTVPALAVLDQSARDTGWLRLVWGRMPGGLSQAPSLEPVAQGDPDFGGWRDATALSRAIRWISELDTAAKADFLAGRVVAKDVPVRTPKPLPALGPSASAEDYRELRVTAGGLVRPFLLGVPDEAHLFPYQTVGVEWLLDHGNGILADDMGLGKGVQTIAALRQLIHFGVARGGLIVCPRSLIANWEEELSKWAPELSRLRVIPSARDKHEVWATITGRVHVLLTSYEHLRDPPPTLRTCHLDVIIADEAHRIRNLSAAVTQGIRALHWRRFWALTGTPIERDPKDLATLLSTLDPRRFTAGDSSLSLSTLRARASPYILRRLKVEVLDQLPPVLDSKETLELLPPQQRAYRRALKDTMRSGGSGSFLRLINELRTICDFDPETGKSVKIERITEILDEIRMAREKAVVFSYLLRPLDILEAELEQTDLESVRLEGSMSLIERDDAIHRFKSDPSVVTLLASTRVGGEGLTLTEANHVIFLNEWWNPSSNAQARDRVVRIGQRRGVNVYRFRCKGTIEQVLDRILEAKSDTFSLILDRLADPMSEADPDVVGALGEVRRGLQSLELELEGISSRDL